MNIVRDIQTLSEFKQNASKLMKQVRETKRPLILTVNGKPAAILQDVEAYQEMADELSNRETVRVLKERLDYVRNGGELNPAEQAFDRISERTGIRF